MKHILFSGKIIGGIFILPLWVFISFPASAQQHPFPARKELSHTFYITANTGAEINGSTRNILEEIKKSSQKDEKATLLIPGNFLQKKGYPSNEIERKKINRYLKKNLLDPLEGFNGKIILTPGFHEWQKGGQDNIDDLETFLQESLTQLEIWPDDGCPLERNGITENIELITVDTQWFLEDWDDHPEMNIDCEIKTREQFFIEFKDDIKDNHGKTIIVSLHHPIISNTRQNILEEIGGFSRQDYQNRQNRQLRGRLETLARQFDDVIFVSGKDQNLQFLKNDGLPQIVSGAAAKTEPAKEKEDGDFASHENGYARLSVFKDKSSLVEYFLVSGNEKKVGFSTKIEREMPRMEELVFKTKEEVGDIVSASIYTAEETDKSGFYKWLWGEHYREVYSRKIKAPVLFLDSLPGNLEPLKEGGGMQSRSLRFIGENEHEFTIRALRKSPARFLQAAVVKDHYIKDYIENTVAERYALDLFTTAHPYAPFAVNYIAEVLDIYHAKPQIFYVPKQKALGTNNNEYGDELYMFEAHVGDENKEFKQFGSPDNLLSTKDLLLELRETKDSSYVNEAAFIKARLLDMLIGDWDRHYDQWRWAQFKQENGKKEYYPIPRDRDFAFPKYDGPVISLVKMGLPKVRKMETFDENVDDVEWFNLTGYPLDKRLIKTTTWEDWEEQVKFIQKNLSDSKVEKAFEILPREAQDTTITAIKEKLKQRRENLDDIARRYYDFLMAFEVITGTNKNNDFVITRKEGAETEIRVKTGETEIFRNSYSAEETGEIWIYGLGGDDTFKLEGEGNKLVKLKVLGGEGNDIYDFENTKKAKLYDYKSKANRITNPHSKKWLVDSYEINNYDPDKRKREENKIVPTISYHPDAGLTFGLKDTYTTYGLSNNPFSTRHSLGAEYFFATKGFEITYSGEFANIFYKWNFGIEARYGSPNFVINYFGSGNNIGYNRDAVDRDYNRTRIEQWEFAPSLIYRGEGGSNFYIKPMLQSYQVAYDQERFVGQVFSPEDNIFNRQLYAGAEAEYSYLNLDNPAYPTRGLDLSLKAGYRTNIDRHTNRFGYVKPSVSVNYPLHHSGIAVFASKIAGEFILGDRYEFYHGATLGGNHSLRGYRFERFNGKTAFYHSSDLRVGLSQLRTNFIPLLMGVSAGFDYGRVWIPQNNSQKWHNNYGGSIWINGFYAFTGNLGFYYGDDGGRFMFSFGFTF